MANRQIKYEPHVIDNLTSTSTSDALSANQGKVLNDKILGYGLEYTTGSFSKAVTAQTSTTLGTITLPREGRWLILSFMDCSTSATGQMYVHGLNTRSARNTMDGGGGSINYLFTTSLSVPVYGWANVATTLREQYLAIRISD